MKRDDAINFVSFVVDDSLNGREVGNPHSAVREAGGEYNYPSVLVGWQCGFEPMFVAVHSCLDVQIDDEEAVELATDFLVEREWFSGRPTEPDHIIR